MANAINNIGYVVGSYYTSEGKQHPFLREKSTEMSDLGSLGEGCIEAFSINDFGEIVGFLLPDAFIWRETEGMTS